VRAQQRWDGWDAVTHAALKARAIHPIPVFAGWMCEACAPGFYLRPDRVCGQCPESFGLSSAAVRVQAALRFSAAVFGTCFMVTVLVAKLERTSGEENPRKVWMEVTPCNRLGLPTFPAGLRHH
jgi:hypothetical protein